MGITFRVFLIDGDDSIKKLSNAKFNRLLSDDSKGGLPEYANRKLRYAMPVLTIDGRTVFNVLRIDFGYLSFDSNGMLDKTYRQEEIGAAIGSMPPFTRSYEQSNVVDAVHKFKAKIYKDKFSWEPTECITERIMELIFR